MYERQLLKELESLRPDIAGSNAKVISKANGIPKPIIIPPLEDDFKPPVPPVEPNASLNRGPVPASSIPPSVARGRPSISQAPLLPQTPGAGTSKPPVAVQQAPRPPLASQNSSPDMASTQARSTEPPLGGRFLDGTKSMFIHPSLSPSFPSPSLAEAPKTLTGVPRPANTDPLSGGPLMSSEPFLRPSTTDGTGRGTSDVDPLGGIRPSYMSASMRVQPTRRKLDAREAASKLANMF